LKNNKNNNNIPLLDSQINDYQEIILSRATSLISELISSLTRATNSKDHVLLSFKVLRLISKLTKKEKGY